MRRLSDRVKPFFRDVHNASKYLHLFYDFPQNSMPHVFSCVIAARERAYVMRSQDNCPNGTELKSLLACSAAAAYLELPDTSASSDGQHSAYYSMNSDPPFCYFEGGELKFNEGSNTGNCSDTDMCLCAGASECLFLFFYWSKCLECSIYWRVTNYEMNCGSA